MSRWAGGRRLLRIARTSVQFLLSRWKSRLVSLVTTCRQCISCRNFLVSARSDTSVHLVIRKDVGCIIPFTPRLTVGPFDSLIVCRYSCATELRGKCVLGLLSDVQLSFSRPNNIW